jgi:hypothetical protein
MLFSSLLLALILAEKGKLEVKVGAQLKELV